MAISDLNKQLRKTIPGISGQVVKELGVYIKTLVDKPRKHNPVRASSLYDTCMRAEVLSKQYPRERWKPDVKTQMIFDIGTMAHWWWQNKYLGPAGLLFGNWKCSKCGVLRLEGLMPEAQAVPCKECGALLVEYEEYEMFDEETGISAHSDGIYVGEDIRCLLEFKTSGEKYWTQTVKPGENHIFQASIYYWLLKLEKAKIIYINKTTGKPKEFTVDADMKMVEQGKKKALTIQSITADSDSKDYKRVCFSKTMFKSKKCPWVEECFSCGER